MGLMDKLSSIAAGPVGQTLGGFLSGEIEEQRLAAEIEREKDKSKAGLVLYTQQKLIDENIDNISFANKKVDAIESLRKRGIPNFVLYEMDMQGLFNQDNPNNALSSAQELWGEQFWQNKDNDAYKLMLKRSGQYEFPDASSKYQTKVSDWQGQINGILNNDLGIGNDTVKFLTEGKTTTAPGQETTIVSDAAGANITQDQIPPLPYIPPKQPTADVEETQFRMALQNPEFLVRLGFDIDKDADFDAQGNFNWAAFMAKTPEANSAITLLNNVSALPYAALANGKASELGLSHMTTKHITAGKVNELALANTVGLITSDVIKAVSEEAHKELVIDTIRSNNPDFKLETPTAKLINILDRTNPNWLDNFKNMKFDGDDINPFMNTPLEFVMSENLKLAAIPEDAYKSYANNKLNDALYDGKMTYEGIRNLHSKYYGTQTTLTIETGLLAPDDPVLSGTGRSELVGGPTAEDIQYSEQYMVPSSVAFKKDKIGETYTPVQGMGETSSVLLSGTDMDTPEKIEDVLKQYVGDIEGLEAYVMSILMGQQENGMLPKQLTPTDMQILKDSLMDDIFDFEYNVKEDKAEAGGSIDDTDVEDEVVKNVEENIITEDFPVDTKVETQKEKIDNIVNTTTKTIDTAKDFLEEVKSDTRTREEKKEDRRKKEKEIVDSVGNWFKDLLKGE